MDIVDILKFGYQLEKIIFFDKYIDSVVCKGFMLTMYSINKMKWGLIYV